MEKLKPTDFIRVQNLRVANMQRLDSAPRDGSVDFIPPNKIQVELSEPQTWGTAVKIETAANLQQVLNWADIARHDVEMYIVKKGPCMAALGLALIHEAFNYGLTDEDHEDIGEQVHKIMGVRILTKVDDITFVYGIDGKHNEMRINDVVVCTAAKVSQYPRMGDALLFEEQSEDDEGMVHAVEFMNSQYFKTGYFSHRSCIAERVRPATPEQIKEYLTLKYKYETDKNK